MSSKKNQSPPVTEKPAKEVKAIRLKPSATDYATAARTTAEAMGLKGAIASKARPNMRLLSLVRLGS